jgi:hypothetical protein
MIQYLLVGCVLLDATCITHKRSHNPLDTFETELWEPKSPAGAEKDLIAFTGEWLEGKFRALVGLLTSRREPRRHGDGDDDDEARCFYVL